jgi:hypothetical protein
VVQRECTGQLGAREATSDGTQLQPEDILVWHSDHTNRWRFDRKLSFPHLPAKKKDRRNANPPSDLRLNEPFLPEQLVDRSLDNINGDDHHLMVGDEIQHGCTFLCGDAEP